MSGAGEGMLLVVRGEAGAVREEVAALLREQGWRVQDPGPGEDLVIERGSRGRTIVLGSLAGSAFYLSGRVGVREGDGGAIVEHRWGPGAGLVLGGTLGRARAGRAHAELADAIEQAFGAQDRLLRRR